MNRHRILRLLRIGWSAGCVIACLLLIGLWVRSYWWSDHFTFTKYEVWSVRGNFVIHFFTGSGGFPSAELLGYGKTSLKNTASPPYGTPTWDFLVMYGSTWRGMPTYITCRLPALFVVSVMGMVVPWIPWSKRFSLRALLVVTTVVAVVLGVIVWVR